MNQRAMHPKLTTGHGAGAIRLTTAQALVRYLARFARRRHGEPLFGGVFAIFGHGNVAGIGEALYQHRDELADLSRPQRAGDGAQPRSRMPRRTCAGA